MIEHGTVVGAWQADVRIFSKKILSSFSLLHFYIPVQPCLGGLLMVDQHRETVPGLKGCFRLIGRQNKQNRNNFQHRRFSQKKIFYSSDSWTKHRSCQLREGNSGRAGLPDQDSSISESSSAPMSPRICSNVHTAETSKLGSVPCSACWWGVRVRGYFLGTGLSTQQS